MSVLSFNSQVFFSMISAILKPFSSCCMHLPPVFGCIVFSFCLPRGVNVASFPVCVNDVRRFLMTDRMLEPLFVPAEEMQVSKRQPLKLTISFNIHVF